MMRTPTTLAALFLLGSSFTFMAAAAPPAGKGAKTGEITSPFARGEKLPGDLSDLLDADSNGAITDQEAKKAAADFQKEANAGAKSDRGKAILDALDKDKNGKLDGNEAAEGVARGRMNDGAAGQQVAEMFAALDVDSDGFVNVEEFGGLIRRLGPLGRVLQPRLGQFFNQMDADRDARISVVESQFAVDFFAQQAKLKQDRRDAADKQLQLAKQTLKRLDRDGDDRLSVQEARRDRVLTRVFAQVDTDSDQHVTVEEMHAYLKQNAAGGK